jgi:hypothetical protein
MILCKKTGLESSPISDPSFWVFNISNPIPSSTMTTTSINTRVNYFYIYFELIHSDFQLTTTSIALSTTSTNLPILTSTTTITTISFTITTALPSMHVKYPIDMVT